MQCEFPILETPRLILRQINLSDAESIQKDLSDANTVMYSNTNQPPTKEEDVARRYKLSKNVCCCFW